MWYSANLYSVTALLIKSAKKVKKAVKYENLIYIFEILKHIVELNSEKNKSRTSQKQSNSYAHEKLSENLPSMRFDADPKQYSMTSCNITYHTSSNNENEFNTWYKITSNLC